ncbi:putative ribonuclease H-like domain-containing protein [Tanacetum coccineum]
MAFLSSPSSTNEVNTAYGVSTATQVSPASTQKTGRKITINGSDIAGYDKSKVECFNCHKMGHFARECRGPRNQDSRNMNQDSSRRTINVEESSSKAMVAIDGAVFNKSEFNLATYKRGLTSVEEQLVFYKKNEVIFYEQLVVLKRDISYKDSKLSMLKSDLEKLKQEKETNQLKIENFDNASKSLDKLIGSHIPNKSRKSVGFVSYNAVLPPPTGFFSPPKFDLSNSSLEEFQQPEFESYGPKTSKSVSEDMSNEVKESPNTPLVKWLVSDDKLEKKTIFPTVAKIKFVKPKQQEKPVRKPVKYPKMCRPNSEVVNDVRANKVNDVKASACWVWRPTKLNSASITLKRHNYVDARGRSKNLIEDKLPFWARSQRRWKITGKGTLKTENLVRGLPTKRFENDQHVACLNESNPKPLFKNRVMSEFCEKKGIKKEFSVARTPQQNSVAERRNRTLIEAARIMLADSKLPTTFWAEAVNTACYVQNRVLVVKPHNKTPYELFRGRTSTLSFMRPFGCHVTILNTLDYLVKFDGKCDEGFFVGYSLNSKAFRVYNIRTRKVEENLHIRFLEDKPIIVGTKKSIGTGHSSKETGYSQDYILMPLWKDGSLFDSSLKNDNNDEPQPSSDVGKKDDEGVSKESGIDDQKRPENSTQDVNTDGLSINTTSINVNTSSLNINTVSPTVTTARSNGSQTKPGMFSLGDNATLEATHTNFFSDDPKVDMSNITTTYLVPFTPNTRIHKDHSLDHVIGDVKSSVQIRRMTKTTNEQGFISAVYEGKTHKDLHTCLFACFLSQEEPKRIAKALSDSAWVEAMHKELLQFKLQKSAFLYGRIEEKVYVDDIIFGSTKKELCTEFEKLMHEKFQMSSIGELTFFLGLQVKQKEDVIFISQDKYVADILRKFSFTDVRTASTPMDTEKPLLKDSDGDDVDVHLYRYLKGQPKLGLWYPRDSSFDLVAYSDSDYAGASFDRKSTT